MKPYPDNWAVVVPMANEEADFPPFATRLRIAMDELEGGHAYFVIDELSKDRTLEMCRELADADRRFRVIWTPENRNVVHAYLRRFREALAHDFEIVIEMDAGMSHDPRALSAFLRALH